MRFVTTSRSNHFLAFGREIVPVSSMVQGTEKNLYDTVGDDFIACVCVCVFVCGCVCGGWVGVCVLYVCVCVCSVSVTLSPSKHADSTY